MCRRLENLARFSASRWNEACREVLLAPINRYNPNVPFAPLEGGGGRRNKR